MHINDDVAGENLEFLIFVLQTFVGRVYLIPSASMEPTLHGCNGCVGDRIMVDKLTYRFSQPEPGDVIVFKGPPNWSIGYKSIRSDNTAIRWVQNALSFVGFVPPDAFRLKAEGPVANARRVAPIDYVLHYRLMQATGTDTRELPAIGLVAALAPPNHRRWAMKLRSIACAQRSGA